MSNQQSRATDLSPSSLGDAAITDALTLNFGTRGVGDWVSEPFSAPGATGQGARGGGAGSLSFLFDFNFGTHTSIELLPEHAPPGSGVPADADFYPVGVLNGSSQVINDVPILDPTTIEVGQTKIDLSFEVPSLHWLRIRARGVGGAGGTLQAKVTAGRS